MNNAGRINSITPQHALPGGEISIEMEGFRVEAGSRSACYIAGMVSRIIASSSNRILAEVPADIIDFTEATVQVESGDEISNEAVVNIAGLIADEMHMVASPAVDPKDSAVILTRSGGRGQQLDATLFRLETEGYLDELPVEIMNPTGIAFNPEGELFVTNRAAGIVFRIEGAEDAVPFATGLGIATGLAFDADGVMFVGDRSGTIYRIDSDGIPDSFARLEPSVAAYHLAFSPDGRLFVTAPGLASSESVFAIDREGNVETFFRGLGRPQGIAFDTDGNLYAAACYAAKRGVVKIASDGSAAELIVSGNGVVGLCFSRKGEMIVATGDAVYSLPMSITGTLL
jgi:sugar lactone lactonase YvrE